MESPSLQQIPTQNESTYFASVPKIYLLIFVWFSYSFIGSAISLGQFLLVFTQESGGVLSLSGGFFINLLVISLFNFVICGALIWAMYKQVSWLKPLVVLWFILTILITSYTLYPYLELFSSNFQNFYQFVSLIPSVISGLLNCYIFYYLCKKVKYNVPA